MIHVVFFVRHPNVHFFTMRDVVLSLDAPKDADDLDHLKKAIIEDQVPKMEHEGYRLDAGPGDIFKGPVEITVVNWQVM